MDKAITRPVILAFSLPYPIVHIILGLANLHKVTTIAPALIAMVICAAVILVVTLPPVGRPLELRAAWAAVVGVLFMEVLVKSALPIGIHPGYAAWHNGAIQMLLVTVALRGRMRLAWLGMGVFAAMDFTTSLVQRLTFVEALAMVITPILWMAMATALSIILRRCARQTQDFTGQEQAAASELASENARQVAQSEWMRDLSRATRPMLERIAAGPLQPGEQRECLLLEAELRDGIRGRVLATPLVQQAARNARGRGVSVDLLDDRATELPEEQLAEVIEQLVGALQRAEDGAVKCRVPPEGSDIAATILAYRDKSGDEFYLEIKTFTPARQPDTPVSRQ
ncbi:hypothetical protein [Paenarthrobacter aromaticivorans]|uniref:hypothetical protein n=1 Tax=Paenarthrobacter aromaticivorans TaxID=2849150 RepID=UPI003A810D85